MSKFVAECPVEGCSFRKKSFWRNVAKREVVRHIYRTDGEGHGPRGSHPGRNFKIEVEEVESE